MSSQTVQNNDALLHFQALEIEILRALLHQLENRTVVDAGAELGEFTDAFLQVPGSVVYAVEPHPANANHLRRRFEGLDRVIVLELALGEHDGTATLYTAADKTGLANDSYHSLVPCEPTQVITWTGSQDVVCSRIDTLIVDRQLPDEIGLLKIDTERSDFGVIRGLGSIRPKVIMFEFWDGLADTVGPSPYRVEDVVSHLQRHGYRDFALVKRRDGFQTIQINDTTTVQGEWGNVVILRSDVAPALISTVFQIAGRIQRELLAAAANVLAEATARLTVIEQLSARVDLLQHAADERLTLIERQQKDLVNALNERDQLQASAVLKQRVIDEQRQVLETAGLESERLRTLTYSGPDSGRADPNQ